MSHNPLFLVRISPATAKFKAPPTVDPSSIQFHPALNGNNIPEHQLTQPITVALPLPTSNQTKSVSTPIAATSSSGSLSSSSSGPSLNGSNSTHSLPSASSGSSTSIASLTSVPSEDMLNLPTNVLAQLAQQYANNGNNTAVRPGTTNSITTPFAQHAQDDAPRYTISEESWKHHAQARAILGNLIGPNGEQLTSTDPYNTTVFVGGLSPLISEDTLRTFFAPFGDIHYVGVLV